MPEPYRWPLRRLAGPATVATISGSTEMRTRRRWRAGGGRLLVASVTIVALAVPAVAHAAPRAPAARAATRLASPDPSGLTALTTTPAALNLLFRSDRRDYVLRCTDDEAITFSGRLAAGWVARVVLLGPSAPAPRTVTGSFTLAMTAPGATTVRLDVAAATDPGAVTATYRVRCLPRGIPTFTSTITGTPQSAYYLVTHTNWDILMNPEGTPVWWLYQSSGLPVDAKILLGRPVTTVPGADYYFRNWDGTIAGVVQRGLNHHDLQLMPNGDLVGFQYYDSARGLAEEARFLRLDRTGREVWSWRTEDHIAASESAPDAYKLVWGHANSVEPDGNDRLLISLRNLDAIYDVDMASGEIAWKLGGTRTPQSLTVSDGQRDLTDEEVLRLFSGQHDARLHPDGTVSVLDNGTRALARRPRVLQFALDLPHRRATLIRTIADSRADYSYGLGSARVTRGGNWVVNWGGWNTFFGEYTPTGQPVVTIDGVSTYRAVPVQAGEIDEDAMHLGMDAMAGSASSVSGWVTDAGTHLPVANAGVALLRASDLSLAAAVVADATGNFRAPLTPGSYVAYLIDGTGAHQAGFHGSPTPIRVTAGLPTDVTASMTPTRGTLSGTVTDRATGAGIGGAWVVAISDQTGTVVAATPADAAGRCTISRLAPGRYLLAAFDPAGAHATQFLGDVPDGANATRAVVTAGAATSADLSLPPQPAPARTSSLDGTVREDGTAHPLGGVLVVALRAGDFGLAGTTVSGAAGGYHLPVAAGAYKLAFLDPTAAHAVEWYRDVPAHDVGAADAVTAPATTDVSLAPTTGSVRGTLTVTGGGAADGTWVVAIGPSGPAGGAIAADDGTYAIDALAPSTYRLTFVDPTGTHPQEFWADATDFGSATPLIVTAGGSLTANGVVGP